MSVTELAELAPGRYTIAFSAEVISGIKKFVAGTHFRTVPDIVRASLACFFDLLDAEEKGFTIVLRAADGREFLYSPHRPGRAKPSGGGAKNGKDHANGRSQPRPILLGSETMHLESNGTNI